MRRKRKILVGGKRYHKEAHAQAVVEGMVPPGTSLSEFSNMIERADPEKEEGGGLTREEVEETKREASLLMRERRTERP